MDKIEVSRTDALKLASMADVLVGTVGGMLYGQEGGGKLNRILTSLMVLRNELIKVLGFPTVITKEKEDER